jgi:hypothetical protein
MPPDGQGRMKDLQGGSFEMRSKLTLNTKVIGDFISSLEMVETQNFDTGWKNNEGLKLIGFSRYDFQLKSIIKFLSIFKIRFWCNLNV